MNKNLSQRSWWPFFRIFVWQSIKIIAIVLLALILGKTFILDRGQVRGISMDPSYEDGSFFWLNKIIYLVRPPARYEVSAISLPGSEDLIIKRVVGLPGETIGWKDNLVWVVRPDGSRSSVKSFGCLEEKPNIDSAEHEVALKDNEYFVVGDNRPASDDSRHFGAVHRRFILGKVW
jgi:signal peptidase I